MAPVPGDLRRPPSWHFDAVRGPSTPSDQAEPLGLCLRVPIPALPNLDLEGLAVRADRLVQHLVVEPAPPQRSNQFDLALLDCVHVEIAKLRELRTRQAGRQVPWPSGRARHR